MAWNPTRCTGSGTRTALLENPSPRHNGVVACPTCGREVEAVGGTKVYRTAVVKPHEPIEVRR